MTQVGRTVAAAVPIAKGELVIHERPLLMVPALRVLPRELRRLLRRGARELRAPIASFLNLYAYTNADVDVRRKVLTFCSYEVHTAALPTTPPADNDTPPLPRIINVAMRVSAWWTAQPELIPLQIGDRGPEGVPAAATRPTHKADGGASFSAEELTRVQCCFSLNAHEILEDDTEDGTGAGGASVVLDLEPEPEPEPELEPKKANTSKNAAANGAASDSGKLAAASRGAGCTHALFLQGSRLTHVCGHPTTVYHYQNGYGCHRAMRDISAGEMLTSCYLGARAACGRRKRRGHLRENYLFDCGCTTCSEGEDLYRQLPCPHCGAERDSRTGLLSNGSESPPSLKYGGIRRDVLSPEASPGTASPRSGSTNTSSDSSTDTGSAGGCSSCWHCCSCGRSFTDEEVDCKMIGPAPLPLQLNSPSTLFEWERRCALAAMSIVLHHFTGLLNCQPVSLLSAWPAASLADATYNLVELSDAGQLCDQSPSDLVDTRRPLTRAVRAVLGGEHWATATCEELLLEVLLERACDIYDSGTEGDHTKQGAEEAEEDVTCVEIWVLVSRLWHWFEGRALHAVWSIPEELLQVMRRWPALADYIEADEERSQALREITEATLARTIVSDTPHCTAQPHRLLVIACVCIRCWMFAG